MGEILLDAVFNNGIACDAFAGVEMGGYPLVSAASLISYLRGNQKDAIYVRKEEKMHGSKRRLEGNTKIPAGSSIVLLEDVVTTGKSVLLAAETLQSAGYLVSGIIALVDRLQGGREEIEKVGLKFVSIFSRTDFMIEMIR